MRRTATCSSPRSIARLQALAGTGEAGSNPFSVRGAKVAVAERDRLLFIEIRAPKPDQAGEVLRRAQVLSAAGTAAP